MWIELHDTFLDHRKVKRLSRLFNVCPVTVRGHIATLWLNVLRQSPDGDLSDWTVQDICDCSEWPGDEHQEFVDALTSCGWLDKHEDGHYSIHDWFDFAGSLKAAQKKRIQREKKRANKPADKKVSEECPGTVAGQSGKVPLDRTRPDQTGPDLKPMSSSKQLDLAPVEVVDKKRDEVLAVFTHYRTHHPKACPNPQPTSREWKLIKARLAEGYSVERLCKAIDGCHRTPHNLGQNEQHIKYLQLDLIVRNSSQVERFEANASAAPIDRTVSGGRERLA